MAGQGREKGRGVRHTHGRDHPRVVRHDDEQYKKLKGLKKENLRDNMTTTEIILNMLAETSTTDIFQSNEAGNF